VAKILALVAVLSAGVFVLSACEAPPEVTGGENGAANEATVGGTLERSGIQFTFDRITRHQPNPAVPQVSIPAEGNEFILFWFTIQNTTDEDYFVNMFDVTGRLDGRAINASMSIWDIDDAVIWGTVEAGGVSQGYVVFEVHIGWEVIELRYHWLVSESSMVFTATQDDLS